MAKKTKAAPVNVIAAAKLSDVELLRMGLAQEADIECRDCDRMTPLMCAAEAGSLECVTVLIQAGADVDAVDGEGTTPTMFAAQMCNEACAWLLAEAGADVEAKDRMGRTAADWATRRRRPELARMLQSICAARAEKRELGAGLTTASVPSRPGMGRV